MWGADGNLILAEIFSITIEVGKHQPRPTCTVAVLVSTQSGSNLTTLVCDFRSAWQDRASTASRHAQCSSIEQQPNNAAPLVTAEEFDWSEVNSNQLPQLHSSHPKQLPQLQFHSQQLESSCSDDLDLDDTLVNSSLTSSSNSSCYGIPRAKTRQRRQRCHEKPRNCDGVKVSDWRGVASERPWYEEDDDDANKPHKTPVLEQMTSRDADVSAGASDDSGSGGGVRDAEAWIEEFE